MLPVQLGVERAAAAEQRRLDPALEGVAPAPAGLVGLALAQRRPAGVDLPARALAGAVIDEVEAQGRPFEGAVAELARALEPRRRRGAAVLKHAGRHGEQPLAGLVLAQDDVGDDRLALHVDAGGAAADDVDALDLAGLDAAQGVLQAFTLGGRPLAIDQHIAGRAAVAAHVVALVEREARNAGDHVHGGVGLGRREEGGRIGRGPGGLGGLYHRRLRRRGGKHGEEQLLAHNVPQRPPGLRCARR